MRIGLISFEFAGTANGGGIGTYVRGAARMLAERGHDVEVFTAGSIGSESAELPYRINSVCVNHRQNFPAAILPLFADRHKLAAFDVIEGPEYSSEAGFVAEAFPSIPFVVKLHAPSFSIFQSNAKLRRPRDHLRFALGALRRGRAPRLLPTYDPQNDPEKAHALSADLIVANSQATADKASSMWKIDPEAMLVVPYVFEPGEDLLKVKSSAESDIVLFLGRVEARKGVLDLARAIPTVLESRPHTKFRFVGRILPHPIDQLGLDQHIHRLAGGDAADRIEVTGGVPHEQIGRELESAAVCCFPSDWEASGFVCMEAMAAGKATVGSSSGGMSEIIEHGVTGLLTRPHEPRELAAHIVSLLENPAKRTAMGKKAREAICQKFSAERIAPLHERSYQLAIELKRAKHPC